MKLRVVEDVGTNSLARGDVLLAEQFHAQRSADAILAASRVAADELERSAEMRGQQAIAEAEQAADAIRSAAREEGYRDGLKRGMTEILVKDEAVRASHADLERDFRALLRAILERLLLTELADETIEAAVSRAMTYLPAPGPLRLRVRPTDVKKAQAALRRHGGDHEQLVIEADAKMAPGACTLDTAAGSIDASVGAALDSLLAAIAEFQAASPLHVLPS